MLVQPNIRTTFAALSLVIAMGGCASFTGSPKLVPGKSDATKGTETATALVGPGAETAASGAVPAAASAAPKASPGVPPDGEMTRDQVPAIYKWKLDPIFADDAAFERALAAIGESRKKLAAFQGKLAKPSELRACLEQYFQTRLDTNKLTLYGNLRADGDQRGDKAQSINQRAIDAMKALIDGAGFIRRELLALDDRAMYAAYKTEPKLEAYRPYIEELRRRRSRVLSKDGERVLSLTGDNLWAEIDLNELPSDIENVFKSFRADVVLPVVTDETGQSVQLTLSNYNKLRASTDRRVRRDAVEALLGTLRKYENTFASTLGGQVRLDVVYAKARGYDTALAAYLDKDNIDTAVYRNLIDSIHANLAPLHRYVALRKRLLGVGEMHMYDLYAPILPTARQTYPYAKALEILPAALAPLGDEYLSGLRTGLDSRNGWIDVYPHKDKDSGAFSVSVYGIHPYVKMNYFDERDDLSTLAHEYGHAMHTFLSAKSQPYVTANYVPFVAEIASTFNEKLLWDWLMEHAASDAERLDLLNDLVETIRTTIYRQALFAEFELAIHTEAEKGTPLTAKLFDELYAGLIRRYYGPSFTLGPNDGMEWSYIPHFYYKYYVYSYATGLSAGIALAEKVKAGDVKARDAYLGMLRGGCSKPPLELVRGAGVDLTKPTAVEAAARLMDKLIGQIESMTAKKG